MDFDSMVDEGTAAPAAPVPKVSPTNTQQPLDFDSLPDDEAMYGTPVQQAIAVGEAVGRGLVGPIMPMAERAVGVESEAMRGRERTSPLLTGAGEAGGLGLGLLVGTGEAKVMSKAGELALEAANLEKATSYGAKVGASVVKNAAEMAVLQGSDEASKMVMQDPDATAQNAVANMGLAAALGGAGGAFMAGAVSPLWSATAGPQMEKFLSGLSDHLNGGGKLILPGDIEAAQRELGVELGPALRSGVSGDPRAAEIFNELREAHNPEILKDIKEMQRATHDSVLSSLGVDPEEVANYSENEAGHDLVGTIKKEYGELYAPTQAKYDAIKESTGSVKVLDEDKMQEYANLLDKGTQYGAIGSPYQKLFDDYGARLIKQETLGQVDSLVTELNNELKKAYRAGDNNTAGALRAIKDSLHNFQEAQVMKAAPSLGEGPMAAESVLAARQAARESYAKIANISDRLSNELGLGDFRGAKALMTKLSENKTPEQILKALSPRGNADLVQFLATNFPETLEKVRQNEVKQLVRPAVLGAKGDDILNVKTLSNAVDKRMAGQSDYANFVLGDQNVRKIQAARTLLQALPEYKTSGTAGWMSKLSAHVPQSAAAAVSYLLGHNPVAGYLIGYAAKLASREAPDAVKLAMLKFLSSDQPVKAEGFKAAVDYLHSALKGETLLTRGAKAVFKPGAQVLAASQIPDSKDREKLDRTVQKLGTDEPNKLIQNSQNSHLGHYMPDHQVSLSQTSSQALQYLQSIKPKPFSTGPLDKPIEPSKAQTARYNRALDIAQQPAIVLDHVKDGTLQPTDVADLKTMYPALYTRMAQKLAVEMAGRVGEEGQVPYHTRMGVSLFLGQPIDVTMQPMSIISAQPKPTAPQQPQNPPAKTKRGTSTLGKNNSQYMTPIQSSEQRRSRTEQ